MMIPPSYLFSELGKEPRSTVSRQREDGRFAEHDWNPANFTLFGVDRALVTLIAIIVGMVGYGGLMELVL